jgi:uncharacterized protein YndB with AHSA1/START domain
MSEPALEISRTLDAPLKLVWQVHTEKEHLAKWWGPRSFQWVSGHLDFRPWGHFLYCMRSPAGEEMWGRFDYREIEPLRHIIFTTGFANAKGEIVRAPFAANYPLRVLNEVYFSESAGKTKIALRGTPFDAPEGEVAFFRSMFPSMQQGLAGMLNQLEDYLRSQQ